MFTIATLLEPFDLVRCLPPLIAAGCIIGGVILLPLMLVDTIALMIMKRTLSVSKEFGNQDNSRDPMVIARYMSTTSPATWLVTDFVPETGEAVAYKTGMTDTGWELLDLELARIRIPTDTIYYDAASKQATYRKSFGRIVRDGYFTPRRLSETYRQA